MIKTDFWGRRAGFALIGVALSAVLAACGGGGGGDAGCSNFSTNCNGGGTPPGAATVSKLDIVLSKTSLDNTGADSLTATVYATDDKSVTVASAPVTFSIEGNNAILTPSGTSTGTAGTVAATITPGGDSTVRTVTVVATSGSVTNKVSFNIVQSVAVGTPQAASLDLQLSSYSVNNAGSSTITATAVAKDVNNNALVGIPVQLAVDGTAALVPSGSLTNSSGVVTGAVTIGSDHSNRTITVTATSGTLVKTRAFLVTGANLQGTAVPSVLTAGAANNKVNFALVDFNKNPMPNQAISISGSGLTAAAGTTDSNGLYTYIYTAPTAPGAYTINATSGGANASTSVTVSSGATTIPDVTTTVVSKSVSASPNVVPVNSVGTNNLSTLTATFLDANNVPIPNIRVRFDHSGDANSPTAAIGSGSNLIYSDATGNATTTYAPGANGSPTNGVTITACWSLTDFTSGCPNTMTATLTVSATPVSITIGHGDTISQGGSGLTYIQKFVLLVVDSAGNPKSDVQITPSLDLNGYFKGYWTFVGTRWVEFYDDESTTGIPWSGSIVAPVKPASALCKNEDINRNGAIDTGEDKNNNGQLDPRKSDVSITMIGSTKTDASGTAVLQVEYPKNLAGWVNFTITAAAAGVLSPSATYTDTLPVDGTVLSNANAAPAFAISPYGLKRLSTDVTGYCSNKD